MSVSRQVIGQMLHVLPSQWIKTTDIHLNVTARDENWVRQLLKIYINFWGKAYVIVGIMMDWWENMKVYYSKLLSHQIIVTSDTRQVKQFFRKILKFLQFHLWSAVLQLNQRKKLNILQCHCSHYDIRAFREYFQKKLIARLAFIEYTKKSLD